MLNKVNASFYLEASSREIQIVQLLERTQIPNSFICDSWISYIKKQYRVKIKSVIQAKGHIRDKVT